jgi:small-conductance mechanosensitive channel
MMAMMSMMTRGMGGSGARWAGLMGGYLRLLGVMFLMLLPGVRAADEAAAGLVNEGQMKEWLKEVSAALAAMDGAASDAALPEGITPAMSGERRRTLEQTKLGIERYLRSKSATAETLESLKKAREEAKDWSGFKEAPPYPVMMLEDLLNERDAAVEMESTHQSTIDLYERSLMQVEDAAKEAEARLAKVVEEAGDSPDAKGRWMIEAAKAENRLLSVRVASMRQQMLPFDGQKEVAKTELELLDRKIEVVRKQVRFGPEEIQMVKDGVADRQAALREEIKELTKRRDDLETEMEKASAALLRVREQKVGGEGGEGAEGEEGVVPEVEELAELRLEACKTRDESLAQVIESLESLEQLESFLPEAYELRREIEGAPVGKVRDEALEKLVLLQQRLEAWEVVVGNRMRETAADLKRQEARSGLIATTDARFVPLAEQRAAIGERQLALQRISSVVARQKQLVDRWVAAEAPTVVETAWTGRVASWFSAIGGALKRIWSFEVLTLEDKVELDGQELKVKRGVTLGVLLGALLFFVVAYFASSRVSRRLQKVVVARGHLADAQARTMGNWLMIVVGVLLALATLHLLDIPLTVFAFLGGALAIGLGFGTQTLIKNFISGIILLFERKVRVGDVVDVGGTVGTVIEINTRSSVVRGFDGVEALIPNAIFLEEKVTNWTLYERRVRRELRVSVDYNAVASQVMEVLRESAERHGVVLKDPAPVVIFEDFGDNAKVFLMQFWVELDGKNNSLVVGSDLRLMIEKRFGELGIGVPYPQRDLHLMTEKPLKVEIVMPKPEKGDES